jgi:nucleotide-binding universal stress UspA family protein
MRAKSLLHEMESYLKTEVELSQKSTSPDFVTKTQPALAKKLETDRSRLLREVQVEARQDRTNDVPFKRILVAVDSSPQAMAAIDLAARFGAGDEVRFALVHVIDDGAGMYEGFAVPVSLTGERYLRRERASILLKSAAERMTAQLHAADRQLTPEVELIYREGPVIPKLVEAAREFGADLVVIGTHGRRGISHLLMGSTAEGVLRQAPCPVLSVSARGAE